MLFNVFIYYITSLQIFHLYEFFCTNISQVGKFLEIIQPFSEAATRVFHKESHSQIFCDIHRKTPVQGSIFNKGEGHQACNFIKKRLQQKYFLVNIVKFIRRPILKYISE